MVTGIAYGTFDLLHYGHICALRLAKEQVDRLVVAVSIDEFNAKKEKVAVIPYWQRAEMVRVLPFVDIVIPEYSWYQKQKDVLEYNASKIFIDGQWTGKLYHLPKDIEVITMVRTPDISTDLIKKRIKGLP